MIYINCVYYEMCISCLIMHTSIITIILSNWISTTIPVYRLVFNRYNKRPLYIKVRLVLIVNRGSGLLDWMLLNCMFQLILAFTTLRIRVAWNRSIIFCITNDGREGKKNDWAKEKNKLIGEMWSAKLKKSTVFFESITLLWNCVYVCVCFLTCTHAFRTSDAKVNYLTLFFFKANFLYYIFNDLLLHYHFFITSFFILSWDYFSVRKKKNNNNNNEWSKLMKS